MLSGIRMISYAAPVNKGVAEAKRILFGRRGDPIRYGDHKLRYVPGTRPVRLKYLNSTDATVRNDVLQINFFLERVKPGDMVLDIGGHFGQYAVLLAALAGETGRVLTFEPDPAAQKVLRQNLALNKLTERVKVESVALFDEEGEHEFFSNGADSMSSLALSGLGTNSSAPTVERYRVRTTRLDDYLDSAKLASPTLVKLDTEGAEINILRGAKALLASDVTIVCELHPYVWPEFGTGFDEFLSLVKDAGKEVKYLDPHLRIADGPKYGSVVIS